MSGRDTVSYVFGKGKKKSFKVAMANASDLTEMMQFGDDTLDIWTEHCAWPFGFHYDGQTGEAYVCKTQELLSV